jgi:hypothetical protein
MAGLWPRWPLRKRGSTPGALNVPLVRFDSDVTMNVNVAGRDVIHQYGEDPVWLDTFGTAKGRHTAVDPLIRPSTLVDYG